RIYASSLCLAEFDEESASVGGEFHIRPQYGSGFEMRLPRVSRFAAQLPDDLRSETERRQESGGAASVDKLDFPNFRKRRKAWPLNDRTSATGVGAIFRVDEFWRNNSDYRQLRANCSLCAKMGSVGGNSGGLVSAKQEGDLSGRNDSQQS